MTTFPATHQSEFAGITVTIIKQILAGNKCLMFTNETIHLFLSRLILPQWGDYSWFKHRPILSIFTHNIRQPFSPTPKDIKG